MGEAVTTHQMQVVFDKPPLELLALERLQRSSKPAIILLDVLELLIQISPDTRVLFSIHVRSRHCF